MNAVAYPKELCGPRVLIVEDERVVATHVERSLQDAGYLVIGIAGSAREAQGLVHEEIPDVALVDIRLRGKREGFEIAERLRVEHDVPVVYMTAHTDDDTLRMAARTGAYGYVVKPFTIGEVKSALQVALHKHRLDRHLAERERWFSTTLRAIGESVLACDEQQRVTFMNETAQRAFGSTEEAARGRGLSELLGGNPEAMAAVGQAIAQRTALPLSIEVERPPPAVGLLLSGTVAPIVLGARSLGAVVVLHDVTAQRRRDEQLALTDRLSSLGTLVASVAHEINNPLAYTLGNVALAVGELQRIAQDVADPLQRIALEQVILGLREAEEGAGRVANTVKELRVFGRMEERSRRLVDPRACVDWALRLTGNQLQHQARLLTDLRQVPSVKANELKLSQVVVNLLTNAAQALTGDREDNEVRVTTWTDETGAAVLEVEDNGHGMTEDVRRSVFEPFFTTKAAGHGTGLGLSICRSIIESFGGEISVESEPGKGSRFRVTLPAADEQPLAHEPGPISSVPPKPESVAPSGPIPNVLLIDDEPMIRKLVGRLLDGRCRVTSVESVRAGLAELNERRDFDAILCDLMMPGESGMDFFGVVRRLYPELVDRLAFITGGAITPDTTKFLETASRPVLNKPFNAQTLNALVKQVMRDSQAIRAPYRP